MEAAADRVAEVVAPYLPSALAEWPSWTKPLLYDAHRRALAHTEEEAAAAAPLSALEQLERLALQAREPSPLIDRMEEDVAVAPRMPPPPPRAPTTPSRPPRALLGSGVDTTPSSVRSGASQASFAGVAVPPRAKRPRIASGGSRPTTTGEEETGEELETGDPAASSGKRKQAAPAREIRLPEDWEVSTLP